MDITRTNHQEAAAAAGPDRQQVLPRRVRCPDCGGRGTYRGHQVPIECQTCWTSGLHPWVRRLEEIRRQVALDAVLQVEPESSIAMLRDLLGEVDRLTEAAFVRRCETFLEAAELLRRVDMAAAAEVLEASVMLENADRGTSTVPLNQDVVGRILAGLAANVTEPAQFPDRACGCSARFKRHADGCRHADTVAEPGASGG